MTLVLARWRALPWGVRHLALVLVAVAAGALADAYAPDRSAAAIGGAVLTVVIQRWLPAAVTYLVASADTPPT